MGLVFCKRTTGNRPETAAGGGGACAEPAEAGVAKQNHSTSRFAPVRSKISRRPVTP